MAAAVRLAVKKKKEDEICTSSFSSSTIPLTSGIEEAPQLLLSVVLFYHMFVDACKNFQFLEVTFRRRTPGEVTPALRRHCIPGTLLNSASIRARAEAV